MELLLALVLLAAGGAGIGALGRALLPGPDPMPLWATVAIGLVAALGGGLADEAPRFCSNCGTEFKGDERFCTNCGTPRD